MKQNRQKDVICPNCFGTSYREVLATAPSRNTAHHNPLKTLHPAEIEKYRRQDVVKRLCAHCGHDIGRRG